MEAIKLIIFLCSFWGWFIHIRRRIKAFTAVAPLLCVSIVTLAVYFFGCIGLNIKYAVMIFDIIGCMMLLAYFINIRNNRSLKNSVTSAVPYYIAIIVIAVYWYAITRGTALSHTDDYRHWYKLCKILYAENSFPTTPDMWYPHYIPGAGCWVYVVTKHIGFSVPNCFFAQSLLTSFAVFPIIDLYKGKSRWFVGISVLALLLAANISTYTLLVDSLIAVVPIGIIAYISVRIRLNANLTIEEKLYILLLCLFETTIKNSAIIFVAFVLFAYLILLKELGKVTKKDIGFILLVFISSLLCFGIYIIRSKVMYPQVGSLINEIGYRTFSEYYDIFRRMIYELLLSGSDAIAQIKFLRIVILLSVIYSIIRKTWKGIGGLYIPVTTLAYSCGLLCTYYLTMNKMEANANNLAVLYRYMGSILIFELGMLLT